MIASCLSAGQEGDVPERNGCLKICQRKVDLSVCMTAASCVCLCICMYFISFKAKTHAGGLACIGGCAIDTPNAIYAVSYAFMIRNTTGERERDLILVPWRQYRNVSHTLPIQNQFLINEVIVIYCWKRAGGEEKRVRKSVRKIGNQI